MDRVEAGARSLFESHVARLQAHGLWRDTPLSKWETTDETFREDMREQARVVLGAKAP